MVGSESSRMCFSSRLMNTPATRGRSSGLPVSFSTIEARVTISHGDLIGKSSERLFHISSTVLACIFAMRDRIDCRVSPRSK